MLRIFAYVGMVVWIVFGTAGIVSLAPTTATDTPRESEGAQSECRPTKKNHSASVGVVFCEAEFFIHKNKDEITAVSTVLLAIITACLAVIARGQYTTTRAQLRAYVFAYAHGNVRTKSDGTKDQLIVVTVGNSGQTPAFDLVIHSNAKTFNPGQTLDFNLEKKKFTSKASLAGGGQAQNELPMGPLNPAQTLYVLGK